MNKIFMNKRVKDLTGRQFGNWTALRFCGCKCQGNGKIRSSWECICKCGTKKILFSNSLSAGTTKSCGCLQKEIWKKERMKLIGKKFGRWTILSQNTNHGHNKAHETYWNCRCECGKEKVLAGYSITSGHSTSCGCFLRETKSLPPGEAAFRMIHRYYVKAAKSRKLSFLLTKEEFKELTSSPCHYCGNEPEWKIKSIKTPNGEYLHNGIDRLDNNKGYYKENCVPCCHACNWSKLDRSKEEFVQWIKQVHAHIFKKKNEITSATYP